VAAHFGNPQHATTAYAAVAVGVVVGGLALRLARGPVSAWFALFPGLLAHEVAHFLVALLTRAHPRPLSITPQRTPQGWQLGAVIFQPRALSAGFVALAPMYLLAPLAGWVCHAGCNAGGLRAICAGYLCVTFLWGAIPSRADWVIALRYPLGTLIVLSAIGSGFALLLSQKG
jgi:hypothetical protein